MLNPLAAVPDASLGAIYAEMDAVGETMPIWMALGWLGLGVALAVVVAVVSVRSRLRAMHAALLFLIVIAFGAFGYFAASFGPGMSLADAFMIGGGDHSSGSVVLYVVSLLAAGSAIGLTVRLSIQGRPATVAA